MKLRTGFRAATDEERRALRIPPMYVDAQKAEDPDADLQGIARSPSTGKTLYFYSDAARAKQSSAKFKRVQRLMRTIPKLAERIERESEKGVSEALCLRLILQTGLRNGNPSQAVVRKTPSYGASSLLLEHVEVVGDRLTLRFPGKHGVAQEISLEDATLAKHVRHRAALGNQTLFAHTAKETLAYLRSLDSKLKVHDLRTWFANVLAQSAYTQLVAHAKTEKALAKAIAKIVAARLGNTPGAAAKSYIDPALFEAEKE